MARIKKGTERKIPISFRLESETISRLKKIDKYHSKVDVFINKGIDEYEKWLNENILDCVMKDAEIDYYNLDDLSNLSEFEEILNPENNFLDLFIDDDFRHDYI